MIKTRITEMFGVETPLIMGGMTGVGYAPLVAAVVLWAALNPVGRSVIMADDSLKS